MHRQDPVVAFRQKKKRKENRALLFQKKKVNQTRLLDDDGSMNIYYSPDNGAFAILEHAACNVT
jgi:hypothetical protein